MSKLRRGTWIGEMEKGKREWRCRGRKEGVRVEAKRERENVISMESGVNDELYVGVVDGGWGGGGGWGEGKEKRGGWKEGRGLGRVVEGEEDVRERVK